MRIDCAACGNGMHLKIRAPSSATCGACIYLAIRTPSSAARQVKLRVQCGGRGGIIYLLN